MKPDDKQEIGHSGLKVTRMGLGGAPFGNLFTTLAERSAEATIAAAYDAGIRYFDTAPLYGSGLSETRVGMGLSPYNRAELVISTKVGYTLVPRTSDEPPDGVFVDIPSLDPVFDYSRDAVLRSIEESLRRLQTDRIDILLIHDPDEGASIQPDFDPRDKGHFSEVMDGAYPTLHELREQNVVQAIGMGMNQWQMLCDFAVEGDFDCFLLAGRYTLLEQESLNKLLPICLEKNIRIIIGGPYNSGILATGAVEGAYYNYGPAPPDILERTRRIEEVCARHDVPLQAAALQFPFVHPAVATIIPGARTVSEFEANIGFFRQEIPAGFWEELKDLSMVHPDTPLPIASIDQ